MVNVQLLLFNLIIYNFQCYPSLYFNRVLSRAKFDLFSTSSSSSNDKLAKKPFRAGDDLIASFSNKGNEIFDFSTFSMNGNNKKLTKETFYAWEKQIDTLLIDLKSVSKKDVILNLYSSILNKASPQVLDPLQTATFELIVFSLVDTLMNNHPDEIPITSLIESMTSINIAFVDKFAAMIDDGGSDGYSQSSNQEYLCYQFAGLMLKVYNRFVHGLGLNYDLSKPTQELRLNAWVEPVLRALEGRCVRFLISNVEEKVEEMYSQSFDTFLDGIELDIKPLYTLTPSTISSAEVPTFTAYRDWDYANFMSKVIRNTINNVDPYALEPKVTRLFMSEFSTRLRKLGRPVEKIVAKKSPPPAGVASTEKELAQIKDMLNIGHSIASAVYLLWHVRHNIVGVLGEDGTYVKDYILPISFADYNKTLDGIPKVLRKDVAGEVELLAERFPSELTPRMKSFAALCASVRATATEEYRALITYNSNSDEWPDSRDDTFIAALSTFIYLQLISPHIDESKDSGSMELIENLIAMVALDESVGVREPRAAVAKAFAAGMQAAVATVFSASSHASSHAAISTEELQKRIKYMEFMLSISLRLSPGSGDRCRQMAFEKFVQDFLAAGMDTEDGSEIQSSVFKDIDKVYPQVAAALSIDAQKAKAYVSPLGITKFDKTVGSILMNADVAVTMPELGGMLQTQLYEFADDIMLARDQADGRVLYIAAAVTQSLLEASLQEGRRANINNVDTILVKCFYVSEHPLIKLLTATPAETGTEDKTKLLRDVKKMAVQMTSKRIGQELFIELARLVEAARQRVVVDTSGASSQASTSGWGGSGGTALNARLSRDPKFQEFLSSLQTSMLKEYTAGAVRKSFKGK